MKKTKTVNVAHSRNSKYGKLLEKISQDNVCPFCLDHLKKYHKKPILKETKYWVLTKNQNPYDGVKIQLLFIIKRHIENIIDLKTAEHDDLFKLVKWSVEKYKVPGGAFIMRFGNTDYTGGSVSHLHAQLVSGGKRKTNKKPITPILGYHK